MHSPVTPAAATCRAPLSGPQRRGCSGCRGSVSSVLPLGTPTTSFLWTRRAAGGWAAGLNPEEPAQHRASCTAMQRTRRPGWNLPFIYHFCKLQTLKFSAIIYNSHNSLRTQRLKIKAQRFLKGGYCNVSQKELQFKYQRPHILEQYRASNFPMSLKLQNLAAV